MFASEETVKRYAQALYPVGALLILVPLVDLSLRVFPPQFGTLQWRFSAAGLLLGNMGTILLGIGLVGLVAALSGHQKVLRVIGFAGLALGILVLAMIVLFGLDAIQIRRLATANFKRQILVSSVGALFNGTLGTLALLLIGRGGLLASRVARTPERRPRAAAPVVVSRAAGAEVAARPSVTKSV